MLRQLRRPRDARKLLKKKTFVFEERLTLFLSKLRNLVDDGGRHEQDRPLVANEFWSRVEAHEGIVTFGVSDGGEGDGAFGTGGQGVGGFIVIKDLNVAAELEAHF